MIIEKDLIKINIVAPKKILSWTERVLPNGQLLGEITKPESFIISNILKN